MSGDMMDMRTIRRELNLSQAEFADKLGLHQSTVSRFETGELPIDRRTELAILALSAGSEPKQDAA
jgi:transcriptional regulator with XRE-family HTH domain